MELVIDPGKSVGQLRIGMTRHEIRRVLKKSKPIEETSVIFKVPIDFFLNGGVKVMYSKQEVCEAIEVSSPAKPTLQGTSILGKPFALALATLKEVDKSSRVVDDGILAQQSGIGVFIPNVKRLKKGRVHSVIIFIDGYYQKYSADDIRS